ncbi:hypothetical protein CONLIGDRAFT_674603 [Coniochaeta ligniaria NRRL 30616]|uniref:Ubiquitin-like protease family profile domain-containing protein n=1 Tax=Coniochaeta ligniaria NRRL 30616 TaxID=1408157 RepID=A0A1J7J6H5_9PEZI|nr:hypothetical protein CONLIGDRAFT_674603 [Coniochaeta ligniaria NRRL 30616]
MAPSDSDKSFTSPESTPSRPRGARMATAAKATPSQRQSSIPLPPSAEPGDTEDSLDEDLTSADAVSTEAALASLIRTLKQADQLADATFKKKWRALIDGYCARTPGDTFNFPCWVRRRLDDGLIVKCLAADFGWEILNKSYDHLNAQSNIDKIARILKLPDHRLLALWFAVEGDIRAPSKETWRELYSYLERERDSIIVAGRFFSVEYPEILGSWTQRVKLDLDTVAGRKRSVFGRRPYMNLDPRRATRLQPGDIRPISIKRRESSMANSVPGQSSAAAETGAATPTRKGSATASTASIDSPARTSSPAMTSSPPSTSSTAARASSQTLQKQAMTVTDTQLGQHPLPVPEPEDDPQDSIMVAGDDGDWDDTPSSPPNVESEPDGCDGAQDVDQHETEPASGGGTGNAPSAPAALATGGPPTSVASAAPEDDIHVALASTDKGKGKAQAEAFFAVILHPSSADATTSSKDASGQFAAPEEKQQVPQIYKPEDHVTTPSPVLNYRTFSGTTDGGKDAFGTSGQRTLSLDRASSQPVETPGPLRWPRSSFDSIFTTRTTSSNGSSLFTPGDPTLPVTPATSVALSGQGYPWSERRKRSASEAPETPTVKRARQNTPEPDSSLSIQSPTHQEKSPDLGHRQESPSAPVDVDTLPHLSNRPDMRDAMVEILQSPDKWLSGAIISHFLLQLASCSTSYTMQELPLDGTSTEAMAALRRHGSGSDVVIALGIQRSLVSVNLNNHWALLVGEMVGSYQLLDSRGTDGFLRLVRERITRLFRKLQDKDIQPYPQQVPQQQDANSCGVFVIVFAMFSITDTPLPASLNIEAWRLLLLAMVKGCSFSSVLEPHLLQVEEATTLPPIITDIPPPTSPSTTQSLFAHIRHLESTALTLRAALTQHKTFYTARLTEITTLLTFLTTEATPVLARLTTVADESLATLDNQQTLFSHDEETLRKAVEVLKGVKTTDVEAVKAELRGKVGRIGRTRGVVRQRMGAVGEMRGAVGGLGLREVGGVLEGVRGGYEGLVGGCEREMGRGVLGAVAGVGGGADESAE